MSADEGLPAPAIVEDGAGAQTGDAANSGGAEQELSKRIEQLRVAVADAEGGAITNARKMDALQSLEDFIPTMQRPDITKQQPKLEELLEKILSQGATEPLRRLVVVVVNCLCRFGNATELPTFVGRLLKVTGDASKKVTNDTRVASLDVIGELVLRHGRVLEPFSTDIFVVVAKHMKLPEANARCSAFQCLNKTITVAGLKTPSIAANLWKMLQKMLLDKAITVRTSAAHALLALAVASPTCANVHGAEMAVACLKALAADEQAGAYSSECRFAFSVALAQVLAGMATPIPDMMPDRSKKKPAVTDFSSAMEFLEKAAHKGPASGSTYVTSRAALCLAAVKLVEVMLITESSILVLSMRTVLNMLDPPPQPKARGSTGTEDDLVAQTARHLTASLRHLVHLADSEGCLNEVIEEGLVSMISAEFNEASCTVQADTRMIIVLEVLCHACITAGEGFLSIETKVKQPLMHLVGNHPSPLVQLHATYCMRVIAHSSPAQLFPSMSILLNHITVLNAELLGAPTKGRHSIGQAGAGISPELQPLLRGLFGHCAALAALTGELFRSDLGVPHDVTAAVLGTSRALLHPHPNAIVSAQRRSCAYLLLEGLMCLGSDWVGQRLTTLFALWKAALGKKPVDRAKVLYQQHAAAGSPEASGPGAAEAASPGACRDELLSLLCALRSLYAFTWHSSDTLLTSLPNLHKIMVVFLTNISQLVVALPHPTSPSLRAKYRNDTSRPTIAFSAHYGIPEILLMIRSTMYQTFAAMLPSQYSSRFVPLLNMLADDVTRPLPADFPVVEIVCHYMHPNDTALDLVDTHTDTNKEAPATIRLITSRPSEKKGCPAAVASARGCEASSKEFLSDALSASHFSSPPREGPASTEGLLTPWDALFDPARPLAEQCASAEWDWRCSAIHLLALIMNANDVSEQARAAVLAHLLKRKEGTEDGAQHGKRGAAAQPSDSGPVPCLAVLAYLREHVKVRGVRGAAPPQAPLEQILQLSLDGLREPSPAIRRLHVELLALLFYVHHQVQDSPIVSSILQRINTDISSDSAPVRSGIALLCGVVLRTFAWAGRLAAGPGDPAPPLQCPFINSIVPPLVKLAKETAQPVRLWMLHALHLSVQAAGPAIAPFLKDAIRLAKAHLLADFFESPLVLWVIAQLVHSVTLACAEVKDVEPRDENAGRILSVWNELRHVSYLGNGSGWAFATIGTEALSVSTAGAFLRLAKPGSKEVRSIVNLVSSKLAPSDAEGSLAASVRAAAVLHMTTLVGPEYRLAHDAAFVQEPHQLFSLLDGAEHSEREALQQLMLTLIRQTGLQRLPVWLQTLKEIVLALPPKEVVSEQPAKASRRSGSEDLTNVDEHDDGASVIKGPDAGASSKEYRPATSATKVFAVSCLQVLLGQAEPGDSLHFQQELQGEVPAAGGPLPAGKPGHRMVHHLDTLVGLAAHASSSEEASLTTAGLKLMLLIIKRFRHTRDIQSQGDESEGDCPLLIVQSEAQVTACIRQNFQAETNPGTLCLALELLRDVIAARACNSTQRLIGLLMQPFSSPTFEPDPLYCEYASTRTFVFRLQCVCDIVDAELEEQSMTAHLKDIGRWIEHALRDSAVLLAGLPLQSIKTYSPVCFSLADYKAVQPCFREAFSTLLQGICALCALSDRNPRTAGLPPDLIELALGLIALLLGEQSTQPSEAEMRVYLRAIQALLSQSISLSWDPGANLGMTISLRYFLDLLGRIWQCIFKVPGRCSALLPDLLSLMLVVSDAVWRQPQERGSNRERAESASESFWLHGLRKDCEDGRKGRGIVGACAFHIVASALRSPAVIDDSASVSQALEIFMMWFADALPKNLEAAAADVRSASPDPDDELVAAALEGNPGPDMESSAQASENCHWLWILFKSPFPVDLMHSHPAVTLKHWRTFCSILSSRGLMNGSISLQLHYFALIANKLSKQLTYKLDEGAAAFSEKDERSVVYLFALQVPTLSSMCSVLQQAQGNAKDPQPYINGNVKATVNKCFAGLKNVFLKGLQHKSAKVVQTTLSSMQNLLQNPTCMLLCPHVMPCLVGAMVKQPSTLSATAVESAWGVISSLYVGLQTLDAPQLLGATTQMVVRLISAIADYSRGDPSSFGVHTAAMAQCLLQVARIDQPGLKAEVAALPPEGQQTIQTMLREYMSSASQATRGTTEVKQASPEKAKIELKIKF